MKSDRPSAARSVSNGAQRVLFIGFAGVLVACPLWYGAIPAVAAVALACCVVVVALAHVVILPPGAPLRAIAVPAAGFALVTVWTIAQALVPAPAIVANPIWALASETLNIVLPARISVAPFGTLQSALIFSMCGLTFWLALQFGRNPRLAVAGLECIAWASGFYAVWGLVDHISGVNMVLFEPKDAHSLDTLGGFVSGTLRNRDHFAVLCAMGMACALGVLMRRVGRFLETMSIGNAPGARNGLAIVANALLIATLACAIWLTRSRAVVVLSIAMCGLILAISAIRAARGRSRGFAYASGGAGAVGLLALVAFVLDRGFSASRITALGGELVDRLALYRTVLGATFDHPFVGFGAGAFVDAFPVYRTADLGSGFYWNAAHDIYLEAIFGLGYPAALLLFSVVGWAVYRVARGAIARRRDALAPIVATAAAFVAFAHGCIDFSLHTPAIAMTLAAILGFGCAQSWSTSEASRWADPPRP